MIELTFKRVDPDTGNLVYKGADNKMYVDVEGTIHSVTDEGEPDVPAKNVKVKAGEPVYDPKDRFARKLSGKIKESSMKNIEAFDKFGLNEGMSKDYINRMEGLANMKDLKQFNELLASLTKEWVKEGFEISDVLDYIDHKMDRIGFTIK